MAKSKNAQIDALQKFVSSFQQFERKLDKLQNDVSFHGHTLSELRGMVASIADGDVKRDAGKLKRKSMAIQYEPISFNRTESDVVKRKAAVHVLPHKAKNKVMPKVKSENIFDSLKPWVNQSSSKEALVKKNSNRPRKAELPSYKSPGPKKVAKKASKGKK